MKGYEPVPIAALDPEIDAQTITLMAPSNPFTIAGLHCAFEQYQKAMDMLAEETRSDLEPMLQVIREEIETLEPGGEAGYVRTLNRVNGIMDEIPRPTERGTELEALMTGDLGFPSGIAKAATKYGIQAGDSFRVVDLVS